MKKIIRSAVVKAVAFILILACASGAAGIVCALGREFKGTGPAYQFDHDFEDSYSFYEAKQELLDTLLESRDMEIEALDAIEASGHGLAAGKGEGWEMNNSDDYIENIKSSPYWFHWTKTAVKTILPAEIIPDVTTSPSPEGEAVTAYESENDVIPVEAVPVEAPSGEDGASRSTWSSLGVGGGESGSQSFYLDGSEVIMTTGNITFEVVPTEYIELFVSLHNAGCDARTDYALAMRFTEDGEIELSDGSEFETVSTYIPGHVYDFVFAVDAQDNRYSVMMDYNGDSNSGRELLAQGNEFYVSSGGGIYCDRLTVIDRGGVSVNNINVERGPLALVTDYAYEPRVSLADGGGYTYTDPASGGEYTWQDSEDRWIQRGSDWGSFDIYVGMRREYYDELRHEWEKSREEVLKSVYSAVLLGVLTLLLWIYLLVVAGRRGNDEDVHTLLIDRAPVELTAVIGLGAAIGLGVGSAASAVMYADTGDSIFMHLALAAAMACMGAFVPTTQSLVRNLKNRSFLSRSLIYMAFKPLWGLLAKLLRFALRWLKKVLIAAWGLLKNLVPNIKRAFFFICRGKFTISVMALFLLYTFIMIFAGLAEEPLIIVLIPIAVYFLYRYLFELDKIKTGIFDIRGGNTDRKIEGCKTVLLKDCADALNSINEGVRASVEREVKAQRMKSELITNVSHDLKTPLTSIISYADLLSSMELTPKEANDYAEIIKRKGDRLKKLTQDLFDISKAESGAETPDIERLDIALLLRQSLAELNTEIEKSGLRFVPSIPEKEIFVQSDGKKLSRVFENLLVNAIKYSMTGTRVYVTLKEENGVSVEIKNISAEPMNFDASEITERFVRGDKSRATEGSGLGLAIAKSYAELCGGSLEIEVDGDLFKATVKIR